MSTPELEYRNQSPLDGLWSNWEPYTLGDTVGDGVLPRLYRIQLREKPEWVPGWYCRKTNSGMVSEPHAVVYDMRYWKHQPSWATEQWIPLTDIDWDV
jgi:hypothetical protein